MLYGILVFFVLPIGLPILVNIFRRKHIRKYLWFSPIAVLALVVLISWAVEPRFFAGLFEELSGVYRDASRGRYYRTVFFIPLLRSLITAAACYAVNRLRAARCSAGRQPDL